ncbi:hypothetical protein DXG01_007161 [Tephrocybe rancida]|nr:hypothetical protein DXG01_007161 [Tephrocybe rancida]
MPEPVIPYDMYHSFRDALERPNYNENNVISTYQQLIKQMPRPNQHLLLYVLDLLSVFAQKSDKNLMTASNLAVIFRPGLISHPHHEMSPNEFELSQNVLQFLIAHQDHFMLDIPPPPKGAVKSLKQSMEDVVAVPSSDEESSNIGPGGWKLVNKSRPPMPRRRTTTSKEDIGGSAEGPRSPMSAVPESPLSERADTRGEGMKRSRTLPSSRKKSAEGEGQPRVLRKQKRISAAQPATPHDVHTSRPDHPQTSTDINRYYDDGPASQPYTQNPFDSTTNIPMTAAGGSASHGGAMYSQAATNSMADVSRAAPYAGTNEAYRPSNWMENTQTTNKRSRLIVIGSVAALIILIIIGVVVGVVVSKNHKSSPSSSGSHSGNSSGVVQTDPNDPSTFVKNSDLHQSFYGMAYTPEGSQLPGCGNNLSNVITDIQLISQLTTRIRLYGADCNQSALVLEAIKQTKVDMKVWLGIYNIPTDNGAAYQRQRDLIKAAVQSYGADHIGGITVGNEFMLNYLTANGGAATPPDSPVGDTGAAILISNIQDTRDMLTGLGVSLPVGTSDAGSYFNTKVLQAVDYGMANVHPWFANVSATDAAGWTASFFQTTNLDPAAQLPNKPKMYIAETGWPTKSSDAGNASNGPGTASEAGLQTFMNDFVCQANTNGTGYFFFEYFDEPWKDAQFGGVEGWWGLFTANRTLKHITIPNCQSP